MQVTRLASHLPPPAPGFSCAPYDQNGLFQSALLDVMDAGEWQATSSLLVSPVPYDWNGGMECFNVFQRWRERLRLDAGDWQPPPAPARATR